jgi:tetratricopeptide (TPR) repeat protein
MSLGTARRAELAGRDPEREALWSALCAARDERAVQVAVLRGPSGIGRTRLCRWLVDRALASDLAGSVTVGCREGAPLLALLAGITGVPPRPDRASAVEAALRELDPAAAGRLGPLMRSPGRPWGTVPVVRRLLQRIAEQAPLVLVLDDAQDSIDAVRLARALHADGARVPLLVVVCADDDALGQDIDLGDQVDGLCDSEGVLALTLGPLSAGEQHLLLDGLVVLEPEAHEAVLAHAAGHPGHVVAQVTGWAAQAFREGAPPKAFREGAPPKAPEPGGAVSAVPSLPPADSMSEALARWMARWLAGLDAPDRIGLEQAAVIGRAVDEALWEQVSDDPEATMPPDQVQLDRGAARARAALVDGLIAAGLAYETDCGFAFTHAALVDVLIEQARAGGRLAAYHRACANHLRRLPMPDHALRLGVHLAEAGAHDEAVPALLDGIEFHWKYRDRRPLLTELDRAERCAAAAGWADEDPRRCDLLHTRAQLQVTAGRPDEGARLARQAWQMAVRLGDRRRVARTLWRLIGALVIISRWDDAAEVIPAFLQVADVAEDPAHGGLARSRMARALRARGDEAGAARWFADAERALRALPPSLWSLGSLLELYGFTDRQERILEVGPELDALAYEEGRTDLHLFSMSKQVEAHLTLGQHARGIELGRACLRLNDTLGDKRFARYMHIEVGVLELRDGRLEDAVQTLTEVLATLDREAFTWLALVALLARAEAELRLRDLAGLDRDLEEVAGLVAGGRYERDALLFRLERLAGQLGDAGLDERSARVAAVLRAVTEAPGSP